MFDSQKSSDGSPRVVRLPFTLTEDVSAVRDSRLGVGGTSEVIVHLSDAAMGVSLADHTRQACPDGGPCPVLLEVYWRGRQDEVSRFDALRFVRHIPESELASANRAEVEEE